jgi:hypothetical protein
MSPPLGTFSAIESAMKNYESSFFVLNSLAEQILVGTPVVPLGPGETVLQRPLPGGPPGGPGRRRVAPAPRATQDVRPVIRMVPHEVEGSSRGEPVRYGGRLTAGEAGVQIAGQIGRHLHTQIYRDYPTSPFSLVLHKEYFLLSERHS